MLNKKRISASTHYQTFFYRLSSSFHHWIWFLCDSPLIAGLEENAGYPGDSLTPEFFFSLCFSLSWIKEAASCFCLFFTGIRKAGIRVSPVLLASRRLARSQGASHDYDNRESNHSVDKRLKYFCFKFFFILFYFYFWGVARALRRSSCGWGWTIKG